MVPLCIGGLFAVKQSFFWTIVAPLFVCSEEQKQAIIPLASTFDGFSTGGVSGQLR